jgi:hypothetical protein
MRRDRSCARIPTRAWASGRGRNRLVCRMFREWRDPDSNRGHHDFQSCEVTPESAGFADIFGAPTCPDGVRVFPYFADVCRAKRPTAGSVGLFVALDDATRVAAAGGWSPSRKSEHCSGLNRFAEPRLRNVAGSFLRLALLAGAGGSASAVCASCIRGVGICLFAQRSTGRRAGWRVRAKTPPSQGTRLLGRGGQASELQA